MTGIERFGLGDPSPSPALLADTKGKLKLQFTNVGAEYLRQIIEHKLDISDNLRRNYTESMILLTHFPEADRVELLRAYSFGMRLREYKSTTSQNEHLERIRLGEQSTLPDNLQGARGVINSLTRPPSLITAATAECQLYIISHYDLGLLLPQPHFGELSVDLLGYILDPLNQEGFIDERGYLNLAAITRLHAMFLTPEQTETSQEQPQPAEADIIDHHDQDPQKAWRKQKFTRKQQGKARQGNKFREEDFD